MRSILTSLLVLGLAGSLAACKKDAAEAPEATEAAPEQQTGTIERTASEA